MTYFSRQTFRFLEDLGRNNDRTWFKENEAVFEAHVRGPALQFVTDAAAWMEATGVPYRGEAKKAGGAISRIHRDIRFSKDKTPYHTHMTLHFHHKDAVKGRPSPMIGLRFAPDEVGMGAGIWGGDTPTLNRVRDAIVADAAGWQEAKQDLPLWGDSLKTAPKGYDKDHPLIEDLRRKAFLASAPLSKQEFTGDLLGAVQARMPQLVRFNDFLVRAL